MSVYNQMDLPFGSTFKISVTICDCDDNSSAFDFVAEIVVAFDEIGDIFHDELLLPGILLGVCPPVIVVAEVAVCTDPINHATIKEIYSHGYVPMISRSRQ